MTKQCNNSRIANSGNSNYIAELSIDVILHYESFEGITLSVYINNVIEIP